MIVQLKTDGQKYTSVQMRNVLGSVVIKKKDNYDLRFKFVLKNFIAVANKDKIVNDNNDIRHCNIHWHKHSIDPKNDFRIILQKVLNYEGSFLFVRPPPSVRYASPVTEQVPL